MKIKRRPNTAFIFMENRSHRRAECKDRKTIEQITVMIKASHQRGFRFVPEILNFIRGIIDRRTVIIKTSPKRGFLFMRGGEAPAP